MDYYGATLELKAVDMQQRIITGYAAYHSNLDRVRDIIDPSASVKAVQRIGDMGKIGVFIGHDTSHQLPIGIPIRIEATHQGLLTETKIKPGPVGDDLLETAKFMQENGQPLGMSIGYFTKAAKPDRVEGKLARRIMDYELEHYCFAGNQFVANPKALQLSVKSRKALGSGSDAGGGFLVGEDEKTGGGMQFRVEQQGATWAVIRDADGDADADDNRVVGTYDDEQTANHVAQALRNEQRDGADSDDDDEEEDEDTSMSDGKTAHTAAESKAVWTTKMVNDLPDASFLYIAPGGVKDAGGKTVPRENRNFPYKDAGGTIDLPHLRNAIARIPQSNADGLDDAKKASLQARARKMLDDAQAGKTIDESPEAKTGIAPTVRSLGYALVDLADDLVGELKAMHLLGEETKGCMRAREPQRDRMRALAAELKNLAEVADLIDRGVDGVARNQRYLALLELNAV